MNLEELNSELHKRLDDLEILEGKRIRVLSLLANLLTTFKAMIGTASVTGVRTIYMNGRKPCLWRG